MKTVISLKHIVEAQVELVRDYMDGKVSDDIFKKKATVLQAQRSEREAHLEKLARAREAKNEA